MGLGKKRGDLGSKEGNEPVTSLEVTVGQSSSDQTIIKKGDIICSGTTATSRLVNLVVSGTATFNGPATFTGTPTDIQTENLVVKDPTIALGAIINSGSTVADNENTNHDRGLLFHYNNDKMGFFGMDMSDNNRYHLYKEVTIADGVITGSPTLGNLTLGEIEATQITATGITVNGDVTVSSGNHIFDIASHNGTTNYGLKLGGALVTSTAAELNFVDGSGGGTIVNSKAVIYGSGGEVNATKFQIQGTDITASATELNKLDGVTATTDELNKLGGVTSNIQAQINAVGITVQEEGTALTTAATTLNFVGDSVTAAGGSGVKTITINAADKWSGNSNIYYLSGNVGIGTNNPNSPLHLYSNAQDVLKIESDEADKRCSIKFITSGDGWEMGARGTNCTIADTTPQYASGGVTFLTGQSAEGNAFFIKNHTQSKYTLITRNNGYVGIGLQTLPRFMLHVSAGTYSNGSMNYSEWTSTTLNATTSGGAQSYIFWYGGQGRNTVGARTFMSFFNGNVLMRALYCGNVWNPSDERIKENIQDYNALENLDIVRSIQIKKYEYKDKFKRGYEPTIGFIAQQIQQIIPNVVNEDLLELPNIYTSATVSGAQNNILTFTDFNTDDLLNGDNVTGYIKIDNALDSEYINTKIKTVIDQNTIEVEDDLSLYMSDIDSEGNFIEGKKVMVYGQQVNNFLTIDKNKIYTLVTGAVQEVDRQLQAEKAKVATLETTSSTLTSELNAEKAKVSTLETTSSTLTSELNAEKAKVATLETTSSTLTSELNAEKAKVATLTSELNGEKAKVASLETTVADLVARITALEG